MTDSASAFFKAWQIQDASERREKIKSAVTDDVKYEDPRTPASIEGIGPLSDYVGMFSANAPGWSAEVLKSDVIGGVTRATVAFKGPGPDGAEKVQLGQYFIEHEGTSISRMVGFVGTGEVE